MAVDSYVVGATQYCGENTRVRPHRETNLESEAFEVRNGGETSAVAIPKIPLIAPRNPPFVGTHFPDVTGVRQSAEGSLVEWLIVAAIPKKVLSVSVSAESATGQIGRLRTQTADLFLYRVSRGIYRGAP